LAIDDYAVSWQDSDRKNWEAVYDLAGEWVLCSCGPDLIAETPQFVKFGSDIVYKGPDYGYKEKSLFCEYDPTNGTVSYGNIFRTQRNTGGLGTTRCLNEK
jgi:hypothetical protein